MENVEVEPKSVREQSLFRVTAAQVAQQRKKAVHVFTVVVLLTARSISGLHGALVLQLVVAVSLFSSHGMSIALVIS